MFFVESVKTEFENNSAIPAITEETDIVSVGYDMASEVELFSNAITEGVGLYELNNIGNENIYTEGILSSIKDKVIKIWDKVRKLIANLFHKFMLFFDKIFKSDKDFYNKYKKDFEKNAKYLSADKEWTFEGFSKLGLADQVNTLAKFYAENEKTTADLMNKSNRGSDGKFKKMGSEEIAEFGAEVREKLITKADTVISNEKDKTLTIKGTDVFGLGNTIKDVLMYDKNQITKKENEIQKNIKKWQDVCVKDLKDTDPNYSAEISKFKTIASGYGNSTSKLSSFLLDQVKAQKSAARKLFYAGVKAKEPKAVNSAFQYTDFESYFNF